MPGAGRGECCSHPLRLIDILLDMKSAALRAYEFGPFRIVPEERLLLRDGVSVHLPTRAFDTLLLLIRSAGRLVGRSELMRVVWADACVEEANITLAISMLRKAL